MDKQSRLHAVPFFSSVVGFAVFRVGQAMRSDEREIGPDGIPLSYESYDCQERKQVSCYLPSLFSGPGY